MRVKYKGKFREALLDYVNDQPWMFELDGCGLSFWELPICMQWGVVKMFAHENNHRLDISDYNYFKTTDFNHEYKCNIEQFQEWYNDKL